MVENKLYKIKKGNFTFSISFLSIVILLTASIFFYNSFLEKKQKAMQVEIKNLDSAISEIQSNKDLQIYNLLALNKKSIDLLKKNSQITRFINHLKVISSKYDLSFKGFNYSSPSLTTSVEISSDEKGLAYLRASNFIKSYRQTPEALFELDFINSISGHDRMSFDLRFLVK